MFPENIRIRATNGRLLHAKIIPEHRCRVETLRSLLVVGSFCMLTEEVELASCTLQVEISDVTDMTTSNLHSTRPRLLTASIDHVFRRPFLRLGP